MKNKIAAIKFGLPASDYLSDSDLVCFIRTGSLVIYITPDVGRPFGQ